MVEIQGRLSAVGGRRQPPRIGTNSELPGLETQSTPIFRTRPIAHQLPQRP